MGVCSKRPQDCREVWLPVCGCDDVTYGNACEAARAGQSVQQKGRCPRADVSLGQSP
jgi:hypothetical protein